MGGHTSYYTELIGDGKGHNPIRNYLPNISDMVSKCVSSPVFLNLFWWSKKNAPLDQNTVILLVWLSSDGPWKYVVIDIKWKFEDIISVHLLARLKKSLFDQEKTVDHFGLLFLKYMCT